MRKNTKLKALAGVLTCTMVCMTAAGSMIYAGQEDAQKKSAASEANDETVYVLTHANGKEYERIVSEKGNLHYDGYEKADLPVTMDIAYTLDGKNIDAKKLAGKSGRLEMTIRYHNREKQGGVCVPFLAVSGMILPHSNFEHVEVVNGRIVDDGNRSVVVGYALPGFTESLGTGSMDIPESVTVSADVKNFELETVYTLLSSDIFTEMNLEGASSLGDITESLGKLSSGVEELLDGTKQLADGTKRLTGGAQQLTEGTKTLKDGAGTLSSGTDSLMTGTGELKNGADRLAQGAQQLKQGSSQLSEGARQLTEGLAQISSNSPAINAGAQQLVTATLQTAQSSLAAAGLSVTLTQDNYHQVLQGAAAQMPEAAQQLSALENQISQVIQFYNGILSYTGGVDTAAAGAGEISGNLKTLQQGTEQIYSGAIALRDGQQQVYDGAKALKGGAGALKDGSALLYEKQQEFMAGAKQLEEGASKLHSGVSEMAEQMSAQLSRLSPGELARALNRMQAMEQAAESYQSFGDKGSYDSVKFIFKTEAITAPEK